MKSLSELCAVAVACACLIACGAAEEDQEWVEESDIGLVEQAIGEAACGTNAVPASDILTVTSVQNKVKDVNPTYGSATCTNAALVGVRVNTNKGLVLVQDTSTAPTVATCGQRTMRVVYYKNGAQVASKTATATVVGSSCKRPLIGFNAAEVGKPLAADNARFAVQVLQGTAQRKFRLELTGQN